MDHYGECRYAESRGATTLASMLSTSHFKMLSLLTNNWTKPWPDFYL